MDELSGLPDGSLQIASLNIHVGIVVKGYDFDAAMGADQEGNDEDEAPLATMKAVEMAEKNKPDQAMLDILAAYPYLTLLVGFGSVYLAYRWAKKAEAKRLVLGHKLRSTNYNDTIEWLKKNYGWKAYFELNQIRKRLLSQEATYEKSRRRLRRSGLSEYDPLLVANLMVNMAEFARAKVQMNAVVKFIDEIAGNENFDSFTVIQDAIAEARHKIDIKRIEGKGDYAQKSDKGGIDLNSANLDLRIKRDGNGVPLPLNKQDLAQLSNIQGLDPVILSIQPASQSALFFEMVR